jgi:hypothetical protein
MVNAPEGAVLNPNTGVFTWQPTEAEGPGVYNITIVVSDNGAPPFTDSKTFQVTVNESNLPPSIGFIADQSTYAGTLVSVAIPVTDPDLPAQTFTYALVAGPGGASVNSGGTFTWTPSQAQAPSTNSILVSATDSGSPALSAIQSFNVVVNPGVACGGLKGDVLGTNNTVSVTDWVRVGLFAAGLLQPTNECQRAHADCAVPKFCGTGPGTPITSSDWVQVGRFAAGLDAPYLMTDCPSNSAGDAAPKVFKIKARAKSEPLPRTLSVTNATIARGTTNRLSFVLNAQGNENALGFSINFDTNLLTFISASRGADAVSAPHFLVNTSDLPQGVVGIIFLLPTDEAFPAGARTVADFYFCAKGGSNTVTTPLVFIDSPIIGEVSDTLGDALPASFLDAVVILASDTDLVFKSLTRQSSGAVNLQMLGPAGVWEIQSSSNLLSWQPITALTNRTGKLEYLDTSVTNAGQRFYRALRQ